MKVKARHNISTPYIVDRVMMAKNGNIQALQEVLEEFAPRWYLKKIKKELGDTSSIVYIPIMEKGNEKNILPLNLASRLSEYIGGEVSDCLEYNPSKQKRKELNQWERMVAHREYEVRDIEYLKDNKKVILVDDMFSTGGTIRDASLVLKKQGIKVDEIICLGGSRERNFLASQEDIENFKKRFTESEFSHIEKLVGVKIDELTASEISLILRTGGNENVIRKLERAKEAVFLREGNKVDTRSEREAQTDSERGGRNKEKTLSKCESSFKYISGKEKIEIEEKGENIKKTEAINFVIENKSILKKTENVEWKHEWLKKEMKNTSQQLNKRNDLTVEQKKKITEVLNNEAGIEIWGKVSLMPDSRIAAARILSGEKDEDTLKGISVIQQKIIKDIGKENSKELER